MKYIFFGTPRFAEIILGELLREPPVAIVCNPDRPFGRKKIITAPATKALAEKNNITVFQPETMADLLALKPNLEALQPDFFVVAAYAKIIPQAILDIPRMGTLGVHPSLLPKYRGASPIQSAILNGETETGSTIYLMDEKTDHGPIISQEKLPAILDMSYLELEKKLAELSGTLLLKTIPNFFAGNITPRVQDESEATLTKKFKTEDGFIDADELTSTVKATEMLRKIRGLNPEPGAWTIQHGKRIKLLKAKIYEGRLVLLETQREGERPVIHSL
jgi:methionyl-tRNA formyltransferase